MIWVKQLWEHARLMDSGVGRTQLVQVRLLSSWRSICIHFNVVKLIAHDEAIKWNSNVLFLFEGIWYVHTLLKILSQLFKIIFGAMKYKCVSFNIAAVFCYKCPHIGWEAMIRWGGCSFSWNWYWIPLPFMPFTAKVYKCCYQCRTYVRTWPPFPVYTLMHIHAAYTIFPTEVPCGSLSAPSNGKVETKDGTSYGDVAKYSCSTGYRLIGSARRTCQDSRLWNGTMPVCQSESCSCFP